ncbi:hypothetical protein OROMI_026643 [Orobanche minor]
MVPILSEKPTLNSTLSIMVGKGSKGLRLLSCRRIGNFAS